MINKEPCPDWCTQHDSGGGPDYSTDTHAGILWVQRPARPPVDDDDAKRWFQQLYVTASKVEHDGWDRPLEHAGMALQQRGGIPMDVPPEEARKLAAALIAGAEIVEAAQTATCAVCGRSEVPGAINEDGVCGVCSVIANRERRDRLKLV